MGDGSIPAQGASSGSGANTFVGGHESPAPWRQAGFGPLDAGVATVPDTARPGSERPKASSHRHCEPGEASYRVQDTKAPYAS